MMAGIPQVNNSLSERVFLNMISTVMLNIHSTVFSRVLYGTLKYVVSYHSTKVKWKWLKSQAVVWVSSFLIAHQHKIGNSVP